VLVCDLEGAGCLSTFERMGNYRAVMILLMSILWIAGTLAAADSNPTFSGEVEPILAKNCARCHAPGGIASFAPFTSFQAVRPWAKAIREKVALREMPPWPPDPRASVSFRNDLRLTDQDLATLLAWVDAGAPEGKASNSLVTSRTANGWLYPGGREPDLVISLPGEVHLPPAGALPYVRYLVRVPLLSDVWIEACQTRPSNPSVVHHMAITEVELDDGVTPADLEVFETLAKRMGITGEPDALRPAITSPYTRSVIDMLAIYTPGSSLEVYGNDFGKKLKGGKNLYIDFNIHYQATGKPETDRSQVGFWFRPTAPKHQLYRVPAGTGTIIANGKELLADAAGVKAEGTGHVIPPIPPGAPNYELIGVEAYSRPVTFYQFQPHAHLRAKDFSYMVYFPDGREQTVLTVPKYDFRWQLAYELQTPLMLPAGSKIVVTAHYDNSANNKSNPAPDKEVFFRAQNQSFDEMFSPFVQYSIEENATTRPSAADVGRGSQLELAGTIGCLHRNRGEEWILEQATNPIPSTTQSATSADLTLASQAALGNDEYLLLGTRVFGPTSFIGQRVAVKGLIIPGSPARLNVTSLQPVSGTCP
jgi:hypothetical protein